MEPKEGEIRGSLVGPLIARLEEEKIDAKLLERIREISEEAAEAAIESLLENFDFTTEIYEIINNLVNQDYFYRFFRRYSLTGTLRRAKVQSGGVGTTTLTCKLLNDQDNEIGNTITVYPIEHLGTNNLSGDVWPDLAANDIISVFKDMNGTYYTTFIFDDTKVC
ncbi:hypothetical protein LCGC14_2804480 [marine sediment metagenome]|uniref:Uncharacterized protein n=1 Tax=marine sediment metagenome TaxID=412755 RepID=A0A0F9AV23_9ZZZZ